MDNIISYYARVSRDGKEYEVIEYLVRDHVKKMIELVRRDSKTIRYGDSLLNNKYGGEPGIDYYDLLVFSIVFHDIGKVFYMDRVDKARKYGGKVFVSFSGHEVLSGLIADETIVMYVEDNPLETREAWLPGIYAILFHHHALGIEKRLEILPRFIHSLNKNRIDNIVDMLIDDLGFIRDKLPRHTKDFLKYIDEASEKIVSSGFNNIYRRFQGIKDEVLRKMYSGDRYLKKLMYLTLNTLICLDYEAAYEVRGNPPTFFGKMCMDWLRYYMGV